jgi:hypothetical protein
MSAAASAIPVARPQKERKYATGTCEVSERSQGSVQCIPFAHQNSVFKISSPQPSPAGEGAKVPNFDVR